MRRSITLPVLISVIVCFFVTGVSAQGVPRGQNIPSPAVNAFNDHFDGAMNVHWQSLPSGFQATFNHKGLPMTARFDREGKWIYTDSVIEDVKYLKTGTRNFLNKFHTGFSLRNAVFHDEPDNSFYSVEILDRGRIYQYRFAPDTGYVID